MLRTTHACARHAATVGRPLQEMDMLVLVVEDETLAAFSLESVLEDAGHGVVGPARSSGEAITLARDRHPQLALIDINLEAEGAGISLARQLHAEFGMPVIFTTGHTRLARENADCAIGMITKPFDPAEVPDILSYVDLLIRGGNPAQLPYLLSFEPFSSPN